MIKPIMNGRVMRIDNYLAGDTYQEQLMQVMHRSYRVMRIQERLERMTAAALAVGALVLAFCWAGGVI